MQKHSDRDASIWVHLEEPLSLDIEESNLDREKIGKGNSEKGVPIEARENGEEREGCRA